MDRLVAVTGVKSSKQGNDRREGAGNCVEKAHKSRCSKISGILSVGADLHT
jgi:hypothetical protein